MFTHSCSSRNVSISDKNSHRSPQNTKYQKNQPTKAPKPKEKREEQTARNLLNIKYNRIQMAPNNTMQAWNVDLNFHRLKRTL